MPKKILSKHVRSTSSRQEHFSRISKAADLSVLFTGKENCLPLQRAKGIRNNYSIHYVLEGTGILRYNRKVFHLERGMAFAFFPGTEVNYQASRESPWTYAYVGFLGTKASEFLAEADLSLDTPVFKGGFSNEIIFAYQRLYECLQSKRPGHHLMANGILYQILAFLTEHAKPHKGTPTGYSRDEFIGRAREFVEMNYQRRIGVAEICRYAGFTRSYFSTLFRKTTGSSLQEYLIGFRMKQAKRLLRETTLAVGQVASSVGYPAYHVFERRFKQTEGCAPTAFRNRYNQELA